MAYSQTQTLRRRVPRDFLGHPRGLAFLFFTEMWERFSYYGMRALLVLYMVRYLLQNENADNVIGLAARCAACFEGMFGPLAVQPLASQIYGLYTGLVYLTPVLRRPDRRPRARPAQDRRDRRHPDGDRPFHDGVRAAVPVRAARRSFSATAASSPTCRPRSAASIRPAIRGATAPTRSSTSGSTSAHSWRRSSAARSARKSAGTTASAPPASA